MTDSDSFWAIPEVDKIRTPLSIMKQQAESLTKATAGLLEGMIAASQQPGTTTVAIDLYITVPALRNYRYAIVRYHQPITLYPGTLLWLLKNTGTHVADENEFVTTLRDILGSPETQNILVGLLSQAKEA